MNFRIEWYASVRIELLAALRAATHPTRIKDAVRSARAAFTVDPLSIGESREDDTLRVAVFPPLTIYFAVSPEERLVRIVHVVAPQD